jgi:SagB-type dehydrogenase family enzyme
MMPDAGAECFEREWKQNDENVEELVGTWPTGIAVRPHANPKSVKVEITDVISGRRFIWSPEALRDYILAGAPTSDGLLENMNDWCEFLVSASDRDSLLPGWQHWRERGWQPSDYYYLASRRWNYVDETDPDGAIRTATVENYLRRNGPPVEEQNRDGIRKELGKPASPGSESVSRLLVKRRSGRAYARRPVPLDRLSGLLWYGFQRVRIRRNKTGPAEPLSYLDSYGAAWDFYLCVYNVEGLEPGTYRYEVCSHELTTILPGDHRTAMVDTLQGMHSPATAGWTLGFVVDFPRYQWRYRHEHGLRRLYLEAGIIAQEIIILGMSYGLSTLVTPAQKDSAYLELHDLSPDRFSPVYTLTMGLSTGRAGAGFDGVTL